MVRNRQPAGGERCADAREIASNGRLVARAGGKGEAPARRADGKGGDAGTMDDEEAGTMDAREARNGC
ncbi:MAG: hypothetical protein LBL83_00495 [Clostridiales bacterium]|nr:hypothetical protein [Clostridiales bacterium]